MVQNLLLHLETWREHTHIDRIVLMHHTPVPRPSYSPHVVHLLPIDLSAYQQRAKWPSRSIPTFTLGPRQLLSSLLRQRVFVCLYRAFAESLACENAGRLASMQAAERNIADHLEALQAQYRSQRQHAITAELLDIVSGYEALQGVPSVAAKEISPLRVPL